MGLSMYHDGGTKVRAVNTGAHRMLSNTVSNGNGNDLNGNAIDRRNYRHHYESAVLICTGTADSVTTANKVVATFKLQHSDSSSSGWTDFANLEGDVNSSITAFDEDESQVGQSNYRLATAKRYLRVVLNAAHQTDAGANANLGSGTLMTVTTTLLLTGGDQTPADEAVADMGSITGNQAIADGFV